MKNSKLNQIMAVMMPLGVSAFAPQAGAYYRQHTREQVEGLHFAASIPATKTNVSGKALSPQDMTATTPPLQALAIKTSTHQTIEQAPATDALLEIQAMSAATELLVIDTSVEDYQTLLKGLKANVDVRFIDKTRPGLAQLEAILSEYQGLDALHLVSHADDGELYIGSSRVTEQALKENIGTLARLDHALKDGADLLFYGCNLAKTEKGEHLLELISSQAHIDVAASNNLTGAVALQGDWNLEVQKGNISTDVAFDALAMKDFSSVLAYSGTLNLNNMPTGYAASKTYTIPTTSYNFTVSTNTSGSNDLYNFSGGYLNIGTGGSAAGHTKTYVDFGASNEFDLSSFYIYNWSGSVRTFRITSDKGGSVDSAALSNNTGETVNFSGANWTGIKKITIQFSDGAQLNWAKIDDIAIANLQPSNTAPTLANLNGDSFTYTEGDGASVIDQGTAATVTDGDSADFTGGNMTVTITTGEDAAEDVLSLDTSGTVALAGTTAGSNVSVGGTAVGTLGNNIAAGNDLVVNFNSNATPALVQTLVQAVTFEDSDTDNPTTGARNVRFTVNDGDGGTSANSDVTITVAGANDAPTATGIPTDVAVLEDTASNFDLSAITFTDVDGDSLTVSLTAGAGTFIATSGGSVTVGGSGTAILTLAGTAANINTFLDTASNIQYTGASNVNGNDATTVSVKANDGSVNPTLGTINVDITAVDDTPTDIALTASTINQSATGAAANVGTLSSTDVDSGAFTYSIVTNGASDSGTCGAAGDDNNASFQINSTSLQTSGALNAGSYNVCVQTSDGTSSFQKTFAITVNDDVAPTISSVTIPNSAHKVGDTVTATITVASDTDDYTTGSGGITGTIDGYTLGSFSKTNDTTYTATFTITNGGTDVDAANNVAVSLTLDDSTGNTSGAYSTAISQASDAIYANLPTVSLSTADGVVGEDGDTETMTATLAGSLNNIWPADITVNLAYSGTATNVTDYTRPASIIISANNTTGSGDITGVADTLYDAAAGETVIIDISTVSEGTENGVQQETITITDAESAPTVTLSVGSNTVAENGGTSTITATLSNPTYEDVTVNLLYSGTATDGGTDYNTPSASITITGGTDTADAATGITAVNDATEEGDETIIIDVDSVSGGSASENGTQQQTVTILDDDDTTPPVISSITVPADGTYITGQQLNFTMNINEIVSVSGTPRLVLDIGGTTKYANFAGIGSGTQALVFRYTVEQGLSDSDGIQVTAFEPSSGSIKDGANNILDPTLNGVGALGGVLVESVAPTVTGVSATTNDGSYKEGDTVDVTVTFDESVTVNSGGGTPSLQLETGVTDRQATYTSGSGSTTLTFQYTVQATDTSADLDYLATNSLALNGGTIKDANGNDAVLTLVAPGAVGSLANSKAIVIDTTAPVDPVVTAPAAPQTVTATTIAVSGTHAEDGVSVKVYNDADNNGVADDANAPLASGTVTTGTWSLNAPLALGTNNFVVMAVDDAGNMSGAVDVVAVTRNSPPPPANSAPTISGTPSTSVIVDEPYSFTPSAADSDNDTLTFSITNQPGWASFDTATGVLNGTPATADVGITDGIVISVSDGSASASLDAFSLEVVAANQAPVITPASLTVAEDGNNTVEITVTDEGDTTLNISTQPLHGTAEVVGHNLTYTPNSDYNGNDSLVLTATDSELDSEPVTINITVTPVNDAPVAASDAFTVNSDSGDAHALNVLANDSDVDGDTLTLYRAAVDVGTVQSINGQLSYQPPKGYRGTATIEYTIQENTEAMLKATAKAVVTVNSTISGITITPPAAVTVNATGLFTKVDTGIATATDALSNSLAVTADTNGFFSPGTHQVTWSATDAQGAETSATQTVNVIPMVDLSKNQNTSEGSTVHFDVILNGPAVTYPVTVPYTVSGTASADGSDHNLVDGSVTLEEGQLRSSVAVNIVDDGAGEGRETLVVSLGDPTNAVKGPRSNTQIAIFEENVAPDVSLEAKQGESTVRIVNQSGGLVTVSAMVDDPNSNDTHSYDWSQTDNALVDADDSETTFTFDPSAMSPGFYKLRVEVSDGDKQGKARLKLRIEAALPQLEVDTDQDSDGIGDNNDGNDDSDSDGIPDFLDSVNLARNVVQERRTNATSFLMEAEPGLSLSLGEVAFRANGAKSEVSEDDIVSHGNAGLGAPRDDSHEYNNGLFDFNVEELPVAGQSVSIVVAQFRPVPAGAVYRKLMPSGWQNFVIDDNNSVASAQGSEGFCPPPGDASYVNGLSEGHWCVQLTIEDGGPNDADGEVNQAIDDPGGVAVPTTSNTLPTATDDSVTIKRDAQAYIDVLANDTDADGDSLTITSASANLGSVSITDNQLYYVAQPGHFGEASIVYGISDGNGGSASAAVSVAIVPNTPPVAVADTAETAFETAIIIDVLSNDSDADGDSLTLVDGISENGSVSIEDNKLVFTPQSNFSGDAVITYTVSDGEGMAEGQVVVSVAAKVIVTPDPTPEPQPQVRSSGGSLGIYWLLTALPLLRHRRKQ